MQGITFGQWLAQGGDYVVYLGSFFVALTAICAAAYKAYKAFTKPAKDVRELSEQGDKELHERVDGLEEMHTTHEDRLANDYASINLLKRELIRQSESTAMLTEGVYLIIQHLVTDDHVADMESWMREHAKQSTASHLEAE